jgi:hypothetical protein
MKGKIEGGEGRNRRWKEKIRNIEKKGRNGRKANSSKSSDSLLLVFPNPLYQSPIPTS